MGYAISHTIGKRTHNEELPLGNRTFWTMTRNKLKQTEGTGRSLTKGSWLFDIKDINQGLKLKRHRHQYGQRLDFPKGLT